MAWDVDFHSLFVPEFKALGEDVQDELLAHIDALKVFGPQMGRPRVDTLAGSLHANMKELRFDAADACGGSPSPSTRFGRPLSCAVETSPAAANAASIGS